MKICSKCNKEVIPGQIYCPRCGFSLVKNRYGERMGSGGIDAKSISPTLAVRMNSENINSDEKFSNNKKQGSKALAFSILIFFLISFIPTVFSIFSIDNSVNENSIENEDAEIEKINFLISDIKVLIDENTAVRSSFDKNGSIDLATIGSITNLNEADLTNPWCSWIENYNTEANAILCVITVHDENGDNANIKNGLETLNNDIKNGVYSVYNLDSLNGIYDNLNALYQLGLNSYDDYSTYREKFVNLNQTLKKYISSL